MRIEIKNHELTRKVLNKLLSKKINKNFNGISIDSRNIEKNDIFIAIHGEYNHGIDFIILRPSNVYGNFESKTIDRWSLVPGCFCKDVKTNSKITLMTSGKQNRDFVSLDDAFGFTFHLVNNFDFFITSKALNASSAGDSIFV